MNSHASQNEISSSDAARELLRRRHARRGVLDFTTYTKPDYEVNWHHEVLCDYLDRFVSGEIKRLMVFMPPRHGKSELVSRRLPAYILGRNPDAAIIACSFGADLASRMNRDTQRIIDSPEYARVFPDTRLHGSNVRTLAQGSYLRNSDIFEVVGHKGVYRSAGIGGGITGMGFDFGIIDDPIKDPKEAESLIVRDSVWEWYTGAFWTRQSAGARILLTMTRWHEDDLAGRLLEMAASDPRADQWQVLRLPGVCEDETAPDERRSAGEPLWPSRFDLEYFEASKSHNARQHEAMNQQNPSAREGSMFKVGNLDIVDAAPAEGRRVRYWDKAATAGAGDFTAGVRLCVTPQKAVYVEDVVHGRWSTDERDRIIRHTAQMDGQAVSIGGEQEPGASGKDARLAFIRLLSGFSVTCEPASGSKEVRADPLSSQVNAGNVKLVKGAWNRAFVEELRTFPFGAHDDQVDAAAGAFNILAHQPADLTVVEY